MLKLWTIYYEYDEHEMESDVFVHGDDPRPSTEDARKYLMRSYGHDYMQDAIEQPELLRVDSVAAFDTVTDIEGNPYMVEVNA